MHNILIAAAFLLMVFSPCFLAMLNTPAAD